MSLLSALGNEYNGSYNGSNNIVRIDIRIDSNLNVISGDIFFLFKDRTSGITQQFDEYMYSFICVGLALKNNNNPTIVVGKMDFFRYTSLDGLLEIEFNNDLVTAKLEFKNRLTNPQPTKAFFELRKYSSYFRDVELEIDYMEGTKGPPIYNTYSNSIRPPDLPNEDLSIKSFFAKAGINITLLNQNNIIPISPNETWDVRELHALMEHNMSNFQNISQWRVYLLIATQFERPTVAGIMYDSTDEFPRQGCAVFTKHRKIDGDTPDYKRYYLYAACHELGHAFNLYHSFHKGLSGPFEFPRPNSLSIMNYPQYYPHGPKCRRWI